MNFQTFRNFQTIQIIQKIQTFQIIRTFQIIMNVQIFLIFLFILKVLNFLKVSSTLSTPNATFYTLKRVHEQFAILKFNLSLWVWSFQCSKYFLITLNLLLFSTIAIIVNFYNYHIYILLLLFIYSNTPFK